MHLPLKALYLDSMAMWKKLTLVNVHCLIIAMVFSSEDLLHRRLIRIKRKLFFLFYTRNCLRCLFFVCFYRIHVKNEKACLEFDSKMNEDYRKYKT